MPSSYLKPRARWRYLQLRNIHGKTIKVPATGITPDDKPQADALAHHLQSLVAIVLRDPMPSAVHTLHQYRVIDDIDRDRLLHNLPPIARSTPTRLTLEDAAISHPTTRHDETARPKEWDRHRAALLRFVKETGILYCEDLTLDATMRWIKTLQDAGDAPDTIRHRLTWLRRASRMAAAVGLRDPLSGMRLIRRKATHVVQEVWTLPQIVQAILQAHDPRIRAILALGGLAGLRPSEIIALHCRDLDPHGILSVGRKNSSSVRQLPLPFTIHATLFPLLLGATPDDRLIRPQSNRKLRGATFDASSFNHWWKDARPAIEGAPPLLPGYLRKAFATWALDHDLPMHLWEPWLGHSSSQALPVTARHYLRRAQTTRLRELSTLIEATIEPHFRPHTP